MGRLDGKIAIVTGGNSGIGAATVRRFVEEGAQVALMARREEQGKANQQPAEKSHIQRRGRRR